MLRNPLPTGVVMGAFRAQRVRRTLSSTRVRQRGAEALHHVHARLLDVPVDLHAGGIHALPGGRGQFRPHPVPGYQRHFVRHVALPPGIE